MSAPGGPRSLELLAAQLDDFAARLRRQADRMSAAALHMQWQSVAAGRFRAQLDEVGTLLRERADAVADGAARVRAVARGATA